MEDGAAQGYLSDSDLVPTGARSSTAEKYDYDATCDQPMSDADRRFAANLTARLNKTKEAEASKETRTCQLKAHIQ